MRIRERKQFFHLIMHINLKYLPVIIVSALPLTLIITFAFAFYYKHVTYFVPYISDSGTYPPESCIFGQVLNMVSFLLVFAMYIKYRQVRDIYTRFEFIQKNQKYNKKTFYVGLLAAAGVSLVANFQETSVMIIHWIGATFAFGFGAIYQCLQTVQYFKLQPIIGQKTVTIFRAVVAVVSVLSFISFFVCGMAAYKQFTGADVTKWSKEEGGFTIHIVSTVSEWICASSTMFYVLCFVFDFKNIIIHEPEIFVQENVSYAVNIEHNPMENNKL